MCPTLASKVVRKRDVRSIFAEKAKASGMQRHQRAHLRKSDRIFETLFMFFVVSCSFARIGIGCVMLRQRGSNTFKDVPFVGIVSFVWLLLVLFPLVALLFFFSGSERKQTETACVYNGRRRAQRRLKPYQHQNRALVQMCNRGRCSPQKSLCCPRRWSCL